MPNENLCRLAFVCMYSMTSSTMARYRSTSLSALVVSIVRLAITYAPMPMLMIYQTGVRGRS